MPPPVAAVAPNDAATNDAVSEMRLLLRLGVVGCSCCVESGDALFIYFGTVNGMEREFPGVDWLLPVLDPLSTRDALDSFSLIIWITLFIVL